MLPVLPLMYNSISPYFEIVLNSQLQWPLQLTSSCWFMILTLIYFDFNKFNLYNNHSLIQSIIKHHKHKALALQVRIPKDTIWALQNLMQSLWQHDQQLDIFRHRDLAPKRRNLKVRSVQACASLKYPKMTKPSCRLAWKSINVTMPIMALFSMQAKQSKFPK